ncbi:MAG: ATP-binding protein [Bacteroidia bacterium]
MFIPRTLESSIKRLAKKFPIVSVTGPRQSGKTTLLRSSFPDYTYISLENLDEREFAQNDPRGFLEAYGSQLIIDEAQKVPTLFSYLQGVVDEKNSPGQYILSGSQNFLLQKHITQSLAGRVAIFRLLPFTIQELTNVGMRAPQWQEMALKGFYPRSYTYDIAPTDFYGNYVDTYVERDVADILNIQSIARFRNFVKLCADRVGSVLNLSGLAKDAGIAVNTAKAWLSVLETSYIIFQLQPYYKNFSKRLIKSPKLYFWDTGLLSYLLNADSIAPSSVHTVGGKLFENMMIADYRKAILHQGEKPASYFWRDAHGKEIDLLSEGKKGLSLVEFKSGLTIHSKAIGLLSDFQDIPAKEVFEKKLIYGGKKSYVRNGIHVQSWDGHIEK